MRNMRTVTSRSCEAGDHYVILVKYGMAMYGWLVYGWLDEAISVTGQRSARGLLPAPGGGKTGYMLCML